MVFRRSRLKGKSSEKHEITWSFLGDANASQNISLAIGTDSRAAVTDVRIGSQIPWLYVEMNIGNDATTDMVFHWKIAKEPFGTTLTNASTYNQIDKRFIIKRGMEMLPASEPGTIFKRIFSVSIPPRMQRMGDTDQFVLDVQKSSATATNFCGFVVYKELY